jgi:hypothetical protein
MNEEKPTISDSVISRIKKGQIKMRPRFYFVFKLALLIIGVVLLTLVALFLVSFILFSLRQNGSFFLPNFGFPGIRILFFSLPWLLILGVITLIVTSEIFAKHFSFVYQKPMLYSVVVIVIIVVFGGIALDFTPLHSNLLLNAQNGNLPIAGSFYRQLGAPRIPDVFYGAIFEIATDGFKISTPQAETFDVMVTEKTKFFGGNLEEEDSVIILGKRNGQAIEARDVRKIDETRGFIPGPKFPNRRPMMNSIDTDYLK